MHGCESAHRGFDPTRCTNRKSVVSSDADRRGGVAEAVGGTHRGSPLRNRAQADRSMVLRCFQARQSRCRMERRERGRPPSDLLSLNCLKQLCATQRGVTHGVFVHHESISNRTLASAVALAAPIGHGPATIEAQGRPARIAAGGHIRPHHHTHGRCASAGCASVIVWCSMIKQLSASRRPPAREDRRAHCAGGRSLRASRQHGVAGCVGVLCGQPRKVFG